MTTKETTWETFQFNTLYWDNITPSVIEAHKSVCDFFDLNINYCKPSDYRESDWINHSDWMDIICENSKDDIIGFLDIDCVPINKDKIKECYEYVKKYGTFIGIAQTANHKYPASHIYAGPAFFIVSKKFLLDLNISFKETARSDVAEEVSYIAEEHSKWYKAIYPTHYEEFPHGLNGPKWKLGNYGFFGLGTVYGEYCYHHFRIGQCKEEDINRFIARCNEIILNKFSTKSFKSCTDSLNSRIEVEQISYDYQNKSIEIYKPNIFSI